MVIRVVLILLGILVWPSGADAWQSGSDNKDGWQEPNAWEIHTPSRPSCPVCEVHKPSEDNCPICENLTPSNTECPVCEKNTLSSTECPVCEINTPSTDCPLCPVCENSKENELSTMFYKKMIGQLFDRGTLKANAETGKLERSMVFSLTSSQLKIIENASDVQNLNLVVTAILKASKQPVLGATKDSSETGTPNMILEFLSVISSYLLKFLGFIWNYGSRIPNIFHTVYSHSSELRFAMFVCLIILSIVFIHKRYNKNLIILVIVSFIGFGYFCTYLECNRKLEAEEFIQFIEQTEPDDDRHYFGKALFDFFKPSKKEQKIKIIKDNAKVKLPFCRPDHVLIQYFNDLFFDELQLVVVKLSDSMGVLQSKLPWPWNYIGMIALPFLFMSFLPLLFQYVFNPATWLSALRSPSSNHNPNQHPNQHLNHNINDAVTQGDRLSGDNLKILFEVLKSKEKPETSGVEIVKDLPQATSAPIEGICATEGIKKRKEAIANNNILEEETTKEESYSSEEEKSRKES